MSREAKKKQRPLSELFTWTTTKKLGNAQAKPPWKLAPSYYRPNTFLLPRINKPIMVHRSQVLAVASLMAVFRIPTSEKPSPSLFYIYIRLIHWKYLQFIQNQYLQRWSNPLIPVSVTVFRAHFFVTTCIKRPSFFLSLFLSFDFHRTLFSRAPEFAWAPGIQIYIKFILNLKYSI